MTIIADRGGSAAIREPLLLRLELKLAPERSNRDISPRSP
jgi:hypothetical protein